MAIKNIILYALLVLSPLVAVADDMQSCGSTQVSKCSWFCSNHQGIKSCVMNVSTRSGTCTCTDGTSHSK